MKKKLLMLSLAAIFGINATDACAQDSKKTGPGYPNSQARRDYENRQGLNHGTGRTGYGGKEAPGRDQLNELMRPENPPQRNTGSSSGGSSSGGRSSSGGSSGSSSGGSSSGGKQGGSSGTGRSE